MQRPCACHRQLSSSERAEPPCPGAQPVTAKGRRRRCRVRRGSLPTPAPIPAHFRHCRSPHLCRPAWPQLPQLHAHSPRLILDSLHIVLAVHYTFCIWWCVRLMTHTLLRPLFPTTDVDAPQPSSKQFVRCCGLLDTTTTQGYALLPRVIATCFE